MTILTYFNIFSLGGLDLDKFNDKFTAIQCRKTEKYNPEKILQIIPSCKKRSKKAKLSSSDEGSD
jgi:hypothetical protein